MEIDVDRLKVENNEAQGQFEIRYEGKVALLAYTRRGESILYLHTEVPGELEGHGLAGRLAKHALDFAREHGLSVVPRCPYVAGYIERYPEYADLVAGGR